MFESLMDLCRHHASVKPNQIAFRYLDQGETESGTLTFSELDSRSRALAAKFQKQGLTGEKAILLFPSGLEFVVAFVACLYARVVAVPVALPGSARHLSRLESIVNDCSASIVLSDVETNEKYLLRLVEESDNAIYKLPRLIIDVSELTNGQRYRQHTVEASDLAYLQYTSGSTGQPKGVMISHGNIVNNASLFAKALDFKKEQAIVSWLPFYHDMGLVGQLLSPVFHGVTSTVMSPISFIKKPLRWLRAIERFGGTVTSAPNFAYDLCVSSISIEEVEALDLTRWKVAFNGAEPIRPTTLRLFSEKFNRSGFHFSNFRPCYGMAETTLLVSESWQVRDPMIKVFDPRHLLNNHAHELDCDSEGVGKELVSCGQTDSDHSIRIVNPETFKLCDESEIGEIWVTGPSVALGYWQKNERTQNIFQAHYLDADGQKVGPYLRTGDLGFIHQDEIYIAGRLKDVIIIRGENHYPQDIEETVQTCDEALQVNAGAAFSVSAAHGDQLVIVQELKRKSLRTFDDRALIENICRSVYETHGLAVSSIVLVRPGAVPKTSSGKIRRNLCRERFQAGDESGVVSRWNANSSNQISGESHKPNATVSKIEVDKIERLLFETISELLPSISPGIQERNTPFAALGIDSITGVRLIELVGNQLQRELSPVVLYDYPTIASLAIHLAGGDDDHTLQAVKTNEVSCEPIAIIAMACRLPGEANTPEAFWNLLSRGIDATESVPQERWRKDSVCDPEYTESSHSNRGGFVHDIEMFDAAFFGIGGREARALDPQQRLLLELSWEALEAARILPGSLSGTQTGVYLGLTGADYSYYSLNELAELDGYRTTGSMLNTASGRISYTLGLIGPSISIDTACSSSLVSLHLACQSLRSGEATLALAGGASLQTTPVVAIEMNRMGASSPDGRCKAFSDSADGAGWSDGAGILVLKRLSDAERDGDPILSVIKGSAINQDGRSAGFTAPNGLSQQRVIQQALANAGVDLEDIDYVEAHGMGTPIGDPIEAYALSQVFAAKSSPVFLGSCKSNLGHTMAASGVTGVIKTVLALQHEELPETLHIETPTSTVDWENSNLLLVQNTTAWPSCEGRMRYAGISSFGMSGTNAHVIIEEAPRQAHSGPNENSVGATGSRSDANAAKQSLVVPISAKKHQAVIDYAKNLVAYIDQYPSISSVDLSYHLSRYRTDFDVRAAVIADDLPQVKERLMELVDSGASTSVIPPCKRRFHKAPKTAFVFSDQDNNWLEIARKLFQNEPVFADSMKACAHTLSAYVPWSLVDVLIGFDDLNRVDDAVVTGAASFAFSLSMARLWQSVGVEPDAVVGFGQGEIAAACLAGVLSLEDATLLSVERSRCSKLASRANPVELQQATIAFYSGTEGKRLDHSLGPEYWYEIASHPERFISTIEKTLDDDYGCFVEITGPSVLSTALEAVIEKRHGLGGSGQITPMVVASLERSGACREQLLNKLASLWVQGYPVDWDMINSKGRPLDSFPGYPFQRQPYWLNRGDRTVTSGQVDTRHHMLGSHLAQADGTDCFTTKLSLSRLTQEIAPVLVDHCMVPTAGLLACQFALDYLELAGRWHLSDITFIAPYHLEDIDATCQLLIKAETDGRRDVCFYRQKSDIEPLVACDDKKNSTQPEWQMVLKARLSRCSMTFPDVNIHCPSTGIALDADKILSRKDSNEAFQGDVHAWLQDDGIWLKLEQPEESISGHSTLHPVVLDAALHAMNLWALDDKITNENTAGYVPLTVDAYFNVPDSLPSSLLWVHCQLADIVPVDDAGTSGDGSGRLKVDCRFYNNNGEAVACLQGLHAQRADIQSLQSRQSRHGQINQDTEGWPALQDLLASFHADGRRISEDDKKATVVRLIQEQVGGVLAIAADEVYPETPLIDLGMTSLAAVDVRSNLGKRMGIALPATIFFDYSTVQALANHIISDLIDDAGFTDKAVDSGSNVDIVSLGRSSAENTFFFISPLGGMIPSTTGCGYDGLAQYMDEFCVNFVLSPAIAPELATLWKKDDVLNHELWESDEPFNKIIAESARIRESKDGGALGEIVEQGVREIQKVQPEGPYHIGAFCSGSLLAIEVAQRLKEKGETVARMALIDPTYMLSLSSETGAEITREDMYDEYLYKLSLEFKATVDPAIEHEEIYQALKQIDTNDVSDYLYKKAEESGVSLEKEAFCRTLDDLYINGKILEMVIGNEDQLPVYGGDVTLMSNQEMSLDEQHWGFIRRHFKGEIETKVLTGNHYSMFDNVEQIAEEIQNSLKVENLC